MQKLEVVPAYYARAPDGRTLPFIVSLLVYDANKKQRILPAVELSINRTIDITGRAGLVRAMIADNDKMPKNADYYINRAMGIPDAILLFSCHTPEIAERLMQHLYVKYQLTLVQEPY
ncbi:hypothetical protein [Xylella fastidiosa]|uniref:hypothetical protein n=1 Tax=Xylella fastidiosa TaxID=2371 RepID=UPI000FEC80DD|nr:hypothetical protein [Xylella fastidiosa]MRU28313.1 hypothetical protein [Xylella fastidiosa subsp. multiplex]MRU30703.1 hypothetical protein [Xylella fastidiosa subsp. multiplex]UIT53432.1 hypothetical protein LZ753_11405 [Xylella fastidiosa subsp. fastidiosa]WLE28566.1 hypothetical protein DVS74_011615 [Xylella fastidiosa subsp. multiplex]